MPFLIKATKPLSKGESEEQQAAHFLLKKGLKKVTSRFQSRFGEVDLIMLDQDTLVFVEVRYRKTDHHGSGADSVDIRKQRKLVKTALSYLQKARLFEKQPVRFDVIDMSQKGIQWIKNAF